MSENHVDMRNRIPLFESVGSGTVLHVVAPTTYKFQ